MSNLDDIAKQVLEQSNQQRIALQQLLDNELSHTNRLLVSRVRMGGNEGYVGSVTLEWLKNNVGFAHNLPLLRERFDENGNIQIDEETIELLTQRPLDYTRQFPMAQYVLFHRSHKFPALLAVMTMPWVDEPNADQWTSKRATTATTRFDPITTSGDIGLLAIDAGSMLYALDGQHRLLAIKGAFEFIDKGILQEWDKNQKNVKSVLHKAEVLAKLPGVTETGLTKIFQERIAIEILPAVMQGETREEARRRVRRIFVHVNRSAVTLPKGVLTALDEDSGFRIVGRSLATTHPLFVSSDGISRVELEQPNLPARGSELLTTLEAIANSCELFMKDALPFSKWETNIKGYIPNRPEEDELAKGRTEFKRFVDVVADMPTMQKVMAGYSCSELRDFGEGEEHLMMRPVAWEELADAISYCIRQKEMTLEAVKSRLVHLDVKGIFSHIGQPSSLWWGVQTKQAAAPAMKNQKRKSAIELMIYLLGGLSGDQERLDRLRDALLKDRTTVPPNEQTIGWSGQPVSPSEFMLPTNI